MQHTIGIGSLVIIALLAHVGLSNYGFSKNIIIPLFALGLSVAIYLAVYAAFENEDIIDGVESKPNFVDFMFTVGPGLLIFCCIGLVALIMGSF